MEKFVACIEILCNLCYWEQVQAIYSLYSQCTLLLILSQYCFSQVFPFFFYKVFALLSFILKTFPDMVLE